MLYGKTNREILAEMDKWVIGHTEAKKLLITLVNRSKIAHKMKYIDMKEPLDKMNLLMVGASGTGKTYMMEVLQKIVDFPIFKVDASRLNPASNRSYSCKDVEDDLHRYAKYLTETHPERYFSIQGTLDQMVVFFDEIDKLCLSYGTSDGWQAKTQTELLTFVENTMEFKHTSLVFAGAFTGLREEVKSSSIGFSSHDVGESSVREQITVEDLVEFGLIPELMGRINAVTELDRMTEEMMTTILEERLLPEKAYDMKPFIKSDSIYLPDNEVENIVQEALKSDQGVRHMKRRLNEIYLEMEFDYEEYQEEVVDA